MAFEAFRAQSEAPIRAGRRSIWYGLSIAFHGALLAVGIAYSFWHVEELSPPLLKVTFMSAAPPPPPAAAPPAGGGSAPKKKVIVKPKPVVEPKLEIVQPKETPKEEPKEEPKAAEDHGEKDGVKGGVAGGTPGGIAGGTPGGKVGGIPGGTGTGAPTAPKFLPPNIGMGLKLAGEDPPFPMYLRKAGTVYQVLVKFCVTTSGTVDKVTIMKSAEPQLDRGIVDTLMKNWRFRPYAANGTPIPFCSVHPFEFKTL